jgi:chemotaxis protein MotB
VNEVAATIGTMPNPLIVRGHTDGLPYSAGQTMNNWMLSSARAEATRKALAASGIGNDRFARIEGVADREPFAKGDVYDPRNRRMSIILGWSRGGSGDASDEDTDAETRAAIRERDDPRRVAQEQARKLDMGGTALPAGVELLNPTAPGTSSKPGKH